jgi:hypothetical protein
VLRSLPICPPDSIAPMFAKENKVQGCSFCASLQPHVPNLSGGAVEKRNMLPLLRIESKILCRPTSNVVPIPTELSHIAIGRAR